MTIDELRDIVKKWLFLSDDTVIDVLLATYISNVKPGTPVWTFIVDDSGEAKSELLTPLLQFNNVILLDDITLAGITSGKDNAEDLFNQIQSMKNTVLLILDMATLSAKKKDDKNQIWAKFRLMYDGILSKRTGFQSKETLDAHITMIGGATKEFRSQYIINQQLGSRELLYTPDQNFDDMQKKLEKAMENENYEAAMRKEIADGYKAFISTIKLKPLTISPETNEFLDEQVMKLRITRATAKINYTLGTIEGEVIVETPTRVKKQLKRLYEALMSLDTHYSKERAHKIIRKTVDSSGNQLRSDLMNILQENSEKYYNLEELSEITKNHRKIVSIQLDILWKLGWLEKNSEYKNICGRMMEVALYKIKEVI